MAKAARQHLLLAINCSLTQFCHSFGTLKTLLSGFESSRWAKRLCRGLKKVLLVRCHKTLLGRHFSHARCHLLTKPSQNPILLPYHLPLLRLPPPQFHLLRRGLLTCYAAGNLGVRLQKFCVGRGVWEPEGGGWGFDFTGLGYFWEVAGRVEDAHITFREIAAICNVKVIKCAIWTKNLRSRRLEIAKALPRFCSLIVHSGSVIFLIICAVKFRYSDFFTLLRQFRRGLIRLCSHSENHFVIPSIAHR